MLKGYLTAIVTATACILLGIAGAYGVSRWNGDDEQVPVTLDPATPRDEAGEPQTVTVAAFIGRSATVLGVTLEPLEVVEDSRCPAGVACIQAGTVRLKAALNTPLGASVETFELGVPLSTASEQVTLLTVEPNTTAASAIPPESYRFTFSVETR